MASVCRSLQCLISALTQAGGGGLLFRFACSVVLWGGRGTADKCHWRVWGALAVFWPHWVCPRSRVCAFPVYTAQAPGCSIWSRALRGVQFQFWGSPQKRRLGWACVLCLPCPSSSGSQELDECTLPSAGPASVSPRTSWVCLVSVLGSWSLPATLPGDVNHSESQEVFG